MDSMTLGVLVYEFGYLAFAFEYSRLSSSVNLLAHAALHSNFADAVPSVRCTLEKLSTAI